MVELRILRVPNVIALTEMVRNPQIALDVSWVMSVDWNFLIDVRINWYLDG